MNCELPDVHADLEKAEEPEIKLPISVGSSKKQESSRKACISALLTMPKALTLWITANWKILKEMGIPTLPASWDEAQAGIKFAGRNINNLRCAPPLWQKVRKN